MFDPLGFFVVGCCAGGGLVWLLMRSRNALVIAQTDAKTQACMASLQTELDCERKAAQEKLALLDDAQHKLADSFAALSAEALRRNNSSFIELANVSMARFQESAQGELEKRQTAITELVKPVRESLDKVDAKIQEIEKARAAGLGVEVDL